MDAHQWPLQGGVDVLKQQVKAASQVQEQVVQVERKARPRPQKEHALNCPRCNSTNTKFCYYNNYSLSQPRYFCKTCRRYWTEGGTTRNVPVGGGSRKNNKRSSGTTTNCTSSSTPCNSNSLLKRMLPGDPTFQNPRIRGDGLINIGYDRSGGHDHDHHQKNEEDVYNSRTISCGLIPMFFGEAAAAAAGKSVEFDESPINHSSSTICRHFMPAAGNNNSSSIGFSFVGSTMQLLSSTAGTTTNANNNNVVINGEDHYFKLQNLHDVGHDDDHLNHHHHHHNIGYGNINARTILQQGVFHDGRFISHHHRPYEEEPEPAPAPEPAASCYNKTLFTTSSVAADHHRYEEEQNKGQVGESSGYRWGGMLGGGGSW